MIDLDNYTPLMEMTLVRKWRLGGFDYILYSNGYKLVKEFRFDITFNYSNN